MASRLLKEGGAKLRKVTEEDPATVRPALDGQASPQAEEASETAGNGANQKASEIASVPDGKSASGNAGRKASRAPGRKKTGGRGARPARRVGRPRGPDRVPLSVRILAETDVRLTAAVQTTGQNPQTIVDEALAAYFDQLGIA